MRILKIAGVTVIGIMVVSAIVDRSQSKPNTNIAPPISTVSIIIPTYNEESFILQSRESIRSQSIIQAYPDMLEFILVDSGSTDRTVALAQPYVTQTIIGPRGKLTARRMGIDQAKGDIIVSVDSDAVYPVHWLNTLLEPFYDSEVIAVNGSTIDNSVPWIPLMIRNIGEVYEKVFHPNQMLGRNSAFYKGAYYQIGGWNESINQKNVWDMVNEEEIGFGNRLASIGKVVVKMNAPCVHLGGQKIGCRISNSASCNQYKIGQDRF